MIKWPVFLISVIILVCSQLTFSGPPFYTDDPEPVEHIHWEFYISSINTFQSQQWLGTSPHFEVNYGIIHNMQIHLLLPINYIHANSTSAKFGYAYSEFGIKYRFIKETQSMPQIGTFPIIEIPTIRNRAFSNGKAQIYIPVWIQKSWNKFTTYGGAGFWINPGTNNRNWLFTGWEIQYDFSKELTLGGELYYHSADAVDSKSVTGFNLGGFVNFSEKFHFIFSAGHSLSDYNLFSSYIGLLWTI